MVENQEVANRLAHLADSLCAKCPMSETCGDAPMCGDVQLLKRAGEMLKDP